MTMLGKNDWSHLIPHADAMCLLDAVVAWDDTSIHAVAVDHARIDHPLRGEHGLHAVHLAEYGAQAMAIHGALRARDEAVMRPGMLVSLRELVLEVEHVDPARGRLEVHADCLYADDSGSQYAFRVEQDGQRLAEGRAAAIHTQV